MSRRLFATLGIFLFCAPLSALMSAFMQLPPAAFLPLLISALALAFLLRLLPRGRVLLSVPCTALQFAFGIYCCLLLGKRWTSLVPAALFSALMVVHLIALCRPAGDEYAPVTWYVGAAAHAVTLFLLRAEIAAPAASLVHALSPLYFAFIIFALNEHALVNGMAGNRRPSRLMRLRNRARAAIMAAALLLITHLEAIRRGFDAMVAWIKSVLAYLFSLLFKEPDAELILEGERGRPDLSGIAGATDEPALFWRVLEQIMRVVALALAAALTILIIYKFVRLLIRLLRYISEQLRVWAGRVNEAYDDTVESLLDWGEVKRAVRSARERLHKRREAQTPWEELSPRERVRRIYSLLRKKAGDIPDSQTARSAILSGKTAVHPDSARAAADLYDAARYSTGEITARDAEIMRKSTALSTGKKLSS